MALTTQEQYDLFKLGVGMFDASPGVYYMNWFAGLMESGLTIDDIYEIEAVDPSFQALNFGFTNASTNTQFATAFVDQLVGDTLSAAARTWAIDWITTGLNSGLTRGEVMKIAIDELDKVPHNHAEFGNAAARFDHKVEVSSDFTQNLGGSAFTVKALQATIADVDETPASVVAAMEANRIVTQTETLTNTTDVLIGNIFNAPMVFVPDGSDRILSLQDEDQLTGIEGRTDNTLNVTMGNANADEGETGIVTPKLFGIQNVNIDWTGNSRTLDLRNADATQAIDIQRVTSDATNVLVDNIGTPAADFRVANTASDDVTVMLQFKQGVLSGDETLALEIDGVLANTVMQQARGAGTNVEGFEAVNLHAINGNELNALSVNQMESLIITGNGPLKIATLTPTAPVTTPEFDALGAPGIGNPGAVGLLDLDGSAFEGDMTLDITNSLGGFADPSNSGQVVHGTVTGGLGDDSFWTSRGVAATSSSNRDTIDGGGGNNRLILGDGNIAGNADINNIQTLELRNQPIVNDVHNIDFDAFDAALASVVMRDEDSDGAAAMFNLNDLGTALAAEGLVLQHSVTEFPGGAPPAGFNNATVRVRLKNASGTDDTAAIKVENERNTENQFNYTLNFDGQADGLNAIENVSVDDADTESNIVIFGAAQEHTGTVTLTGGRDGDDYTVQSVLNAGVIEASEQLSNLRLTVGDTVAPIATITQDIRLGEGDDILTFRNINDFDSTDSVSDAGGNDVARAAFSEDADLTLTGIEGLHIIANQNVELGMAGAEVGDLVILADIAADGDPDRSPVTAEPFNIAGVSVADIITLNDTDLTELNFSADLDKDDDNTAANRTLAQNAARAADAAWNGIGSSAVGDAAYKGVINDESTVATFNGVTLDNNSANALTVNINADLDDVIFGATAYNLGQLTAHGITAMNIVISDEDVTAGAPNALTTINNIWSRTMTSLTVSAADDVNLNTVSGAALNNSLLNFDASNVGGDLMATVISLGNAATVTLGDGDDTFSALGSAGTGISIDGGDGDNNVTGSGQSDTITTGSGWDIVAGDRGNNIISTGAGNDTVTAKDGNDTFDVGTGIDTVTDNLGTGIDATLATNTVSMGGGVTQLFIDVVGDGVGGVDVDQMLAVGGGSALTLSWLGGNLVTASAVLDGRLATVDSGAVVAGDANANLEIITAAAAVTFNGAGGNDVALVTNVGATLIFNGGTGNDAAVGGGGIDVFTGGTGADRLAMQNTAATDGALDTVVVADGDSTAAGWDVIVGFEAAVDLLDLPSVIIAPVATVDGIDVGGIDSHDVAANGVVTFDNVNDIFTTAVAVGTGAGQITLANALAYLATNLNGTTATVMFNFDADGDGVFTAADTTFVFQDGAADTVVDLIGTYAGLGAGLIQIA